MLWVSANPGSGKSVLAKYLVDVELKTEGSRTTCYFFFKDDFEDQKSANGALSCILHQLFTQKKDLFSERIIKRFESHKTHLASSFDELWDALIMASQDKNAGELVCILDAFDECEDQERDKLAQALCKFYDTKSDEKDNTNLKFLVTSRPYHKIERNFRPPIAHLKGESPEETSKIGREVDIYIETKVSRIRQSLPLEPNEEQLLLKELRRVQNQTYLWVYLTIDLIKDDLSIKKPKIREIVSSLPESVNNAYEKILSKSSNVGEAKKLLHIVVAAARPLTLAEMHLALALTQSDVPFEDEDCQPGERFHKYIRNLCGLLVIVKDSKIYLLHETAKNFLVLADKPDPQLIWKSSLRPAESHKILCDICIRYLLSIKFEGGSLDKGWGEEVSYYLGKHVFLDYSATNWTTHFRASGIKADVPVKSLRQICDPGSELCQTWLRIYWAGEQSGDLPGFTTLMIGSYFGLEQVVKDLLEREDVEVSASDDIYQRSALSWASENGFDGIVKLLIRRLEMDNKFMNKLLFWKDAAVDAKDIYDRTPLSYAAWNGHAAVVELLLKAGAHVNSGGDVGGTPIAYAICSGHEAIAKQLAKGAKIDSVERIKRGLLLSVAKKGNKPVVKRLLDDGTVTDVVDSTGRTPLSYAAEFGHVAVVRLLLDEGADVNLAEPESNRTPLVHAIENRSTNVIETLLKEGARVNYSYSAPVSIN